MIGISVRGAREKALSMEKENKNKRNQNANGTQKPAWHLLSQTIRLSRTPSSACDFIIKKYKSVMKTK